ncbi:DUF4153 domain-containing protein [Parapedobacter sp. DT-150]|uniref:DUF4153 domain-containing protein n=1 Tax=Parapedobacter sp. DT-150 TaxID=3396162 RepID=UPI003F196998
MKLPSLASLSTNALAVFKRFPTLFITVVFATALCCFLLDEPTISQTGEADLWLLLAVCNLLLTLSLSADLFAESRRYTAARKWALRLGVAGVCTLLYMVLDPASHRTDVVRLSLFAFAFHQLVAFAPFINREGREGSIGFWHFNKTLFLRFFTAALYSATLFAGLAVAILGVEELFNLDFSSQIYGQLFALIAIGFNTLFFLAGVPRIADTVPLEAPYPKELKIFTQYVLVPLMTVYLGILLVYEIKILAEWQLPKGLVATLISGYAVFGILSLLLVWPIKDEEGNRWVQLFSRFFYLTLIPLVILLGLAIYKRVADYGFTEERYILVVLGMWLAGISVYFLAFRKDNIKLIPVSLFVLALLSTFGPQSAASVSRRSQQAHLANLFNAGKGETSQRQGNIVTYLVDAHGLPSLQHFTEADLGALDREITEKHPDDSRYEVISLKKDTVFKLLNVSPEGRPRQYLYVTRENQHIIPIGGYDYAYNVSSYQAESTEIPVGDLLCDIQLDQETKLVRISMEGDSAIVFDVKPLAQEIYKAYKEGELTKADGDNYSYPLERMRLRGANKHLDVVFIVAELNGNFATFDDASAQGFSFTGQLLFKEK